MGSGVTDASGDVSCQVAPSAVAMGGAAFQATFGGDTDYLKATPTSGTLPNP